MSSVVTREVGYVCLVRWPLIKPVRSKHRESALFTQNKTSFFSKAKRKEVAKYRVSASTVVKYTVIKTIPSGQFSKNLQRFFPSYNDFNMKEIRNC